MAVDTQALRNAGMSDADIAALASFDPSKLNLGAIDILGRNAPATTNPFQTFTAPLSNKGNPTSKLAGNQFAVYENQPIRLVDHRTNQVVFEGTGYDAARKASELGQNLTDTLGRKANYSIQTADPSGAYSTVAYEKRNKSTLGKIGSVAGTVLPIAMIPLTMGASAPLAIGSAAGKIALAAGVGGLSSGLRGENILKGAAMGGLGAAGGSILGPALQGTAGIGANAAQAIGTGLGTTVGGLATGQNFKNALMGGAAAGGLSFLGGEIFKPEATGIPSEVGIKNPGDLAYGTTQAATRGLEQTLADISRSTASQLASAGITPTFTPSVSSPSVTAPPVSSPINVTGTRLTAPVTNAFSANIANNLLDRARYSGDGPTPQDKTIEVEAKRLAEAQQPGFAVNIPSDTGDFLTDIEVKALRDAAALKEGQSVVPTFAVDTGTKPVIDGKEIEVTAKKTPDETVPYVDPLTLSTNVTETLKDVSRGPEKTKTDLDKIIDYMRLAGLGVGLLGNIGGGGGRGSAGRYSSKNALNPIFSAKLPTAGAEGSFTVGGLGGTAADRTLAARPVTDWYRYGMGPAMDIPAGTDLSGATSPYAGYGTGTLGEETFRAVSGIPEKPVGMSHGGDMGYSRGSSRESFLVEGPGDGRSDDIPAMLSDGEYVVDAESLALLGNGSPKDGAKKMDEFRINLRKHKGKNLAMGKFSAKAKRLEAYMSGGRI